MRLGNCLAIAVCMIGIQALGMNIGLRLAMWDDGVEDPSGSIYVELPEQKALVPMSWMESYPSLLTRAFGDRSFALRLPTGKFDAVGMPMYAWQDFVAGTNPTLPNDILRVTINVEKEMVDVSWIPRLPIEEESKRVYTIYGKKSLSSTEDAWTPLSSQKENFLYKFFKVGVKMKTQDFDFPQKKEVRKP
jgi:hypothetical protein